MGLECRQIITAATPRLSMNMQHSSSFFPGEWNTVMWSENCSEQPDYSFSHLFSATRPAWYSKYNRFQELWTVAPRLPASSGVRNRPRCRHRRRVSSFSLLSERRLHSPRVRKPGPVLSVGLGKDVVKVGRPSLLFLLEKLMGGRRDGPRG